MTNNLSSKGPSLVAKMMGSNSKINSGACRLPLMWWRGRDGQMQNRLAIHHQDTQCGGKQPPTGLLFPSEFSRVSVGEGVGQGSLHGAAQDTQAFIFQREKNSFFFELHYGRVRNAYPLGANTAFPTLLLLPKGLPLPFLFPLA